MTKHIPYNEDQDVCPVFYAILTSEAAGCYEDTFVTGKWPKIKSSIIKHITNYTNENKTFEVGNLIKITKSRAIELERYMVEADDFGINLCHDEDDSLDWLERNADPSQDKYYKLVPLDYKLDIILITK